MTLPFMDPGDVFSNARKQFHMGIGPSAVGQYNRDYEAASRAFVEALARDPGCTKLDATIDESLGRVFLKVSTGYDGKETGAALDKMNALAHFAADVLGDKFRVLDPLPAWLLRALPAWTPALGKKVQLGREWKQRLHATAEDTVRLTREGEAEGHSSVMSQQSRSAGVDDQSKMIAVTMNAGTRSSHASVRTLALTLRRATGGMLAVRLAARSGPE